MSKDNGKDDSQIKEYLQLADGMSEEASLATYAIVNQWYEGTADFEDVTSVVREGCTESGIAFP
jgi:hypothetical protein